MKKLLAFILTFIMLLSTFSAICALGVSAEALGETTELLREKFASDLKGTAKLENEGHLGVPVDISTFYRDSVTANGVALLYVVGHFEKRLGTDSDEEIIEDFLSEGYSVTVLDYKKNPKAIGNEFGWSVHKLFCADFKTKRYDFGYVRKTHDAMYVVPSGCRIDREVYYYSLDEMALNGTNEYILWLWNEFYAGPDGLFKDANKNDLPYAETLDDMIKKDGSPVDFDLRMDIVYPSNPNDTVPVFALASSAEERTMSLSSEVRPYFTTALLQGYAGVIYDHEYIPMSRQDHYAYYGNYTLDPYSSFTLGTTNANAVHSAAIRRIRYLASTYGYDAEYITPWGFSKSGPGPAILANTKHEEMGEILDFGEYVPEGKNPKGYQGEQPWLYYEGTNERISSNVTVAYSGSGAGVCQYRERLMTEDSVPIVSSIGTADTTGNFNTYITAAKSYFDAHPEIESDFLIPEGLGHDPAYGYDEVKQIEQFNEIWTFLDNHIRAAYRDEAPVVMWATPQSNKVFESLEEPVRIKFSRAMDVESVKEMVKVIRLADGEEMNGSWNVLHGATTFEFTSPSIINGSSYEIRVDAGVKAKDGVELVVPFAKVFTISGDKLLNVYADTFVTSAQPDKNFGSDETLVIANNDSENLKGLLSFKNEGGFGDVTRAYLVLNRYVDEFGAVTIYGTEDFDENTVTYNTAPAKSEKIAQEPLMSEITTIDVTDYVVNSQGEKANFLLETEKEEIYLHHTFDNISTSDLVYDTDYRFGGGMAYISVSSDSKVGSHSLYFTNRAQNSNRIKFLKSFGTEKLTSEHLGLNVKASFWIKTVSDQTVNVGVYEKTALSGVNVQTFSVTPGEWNYIEYAVTVDQAMIDGNIRAITVVPTSNGDYWLDDFKTQYLTGGATFATKEYNGDKPKISAKLVLFTPESVTATGSAATIAAGENADTVLNGENFVEGYKKENTGDTVKGYLKFPISEFDTNSNNATLKFNAISSGVSQFSVYGVLSDDSRFAENFTKGITWNTAFANQIDGNGVDSSKTVFIGSKTVSGSQTVEFDVNDYVKAMKNEGYSAVTFIIVKDDCNGIVSKTTFENMDSYTAYVASSAMNGYAVEIAKDPQNPDNNVLYMEKSGTEASPSGYQQNIALTGLIQGDDTFDQSDIGKTYKVSFKQYVTAPGATAGNYCNISSVGAATSGSLLTGITKSVSSTSTNTWNTIEFTINVNEAILGNKATAIIIASGWAATGIYIDDIVVEEFAGDLQIQQDYRPGTADFEGITEYKNAVLKNATYKSGITTDPTDSTNSVFYFERGAYADSLSFTGLISPTDKFTAADVGKKITVSFRQFNFNEGGTAGVLATIEKPRSGQYFLNQQMTIDRYIDNTLVNGVNIPGTYGLSCATWHTVRFELTVTEAMVGMDCAIVIGSNASTTKICIDDIVVTSEGGAEVESVSPQLRFKKSGAESKVKAELIALVSGKDKDAAATVPSSSFELVKSAKGGESGLAKTYVTFNKSGYYHIVGAKFSFNVESPIKDSVLKLYAIDSTVNINKLTWNNAYGNDTATTGMKAGSVFGGAEIATITLTDETQYTVDVSEALKAYERNDDIVLVLTAEEGVTAHKVSGFVLDLASTVYKEAEEKLILTETNGMLSVASPYRIDAVIENVAFFVDGKAAVGDVVINGQITSTAPILNGGKHTAYAVVTYADGKTIRSEEITFNIAGDSAEVLRGDVNGDGDVTTVDLAELKLFLAGLSEVKNKDGADLNKDQKINTVDLAELKLILAGLA